MLFEANSVSGPQRQFTMAPPCKVHITMSQPDLLQSLATMSMY